MARNPAWHCEASGSLSRSQKAAFLTVNRFLAAGETYWRGEDQPQDSFFSGGRFLILPDASVC
jgi:hypothetical protein